MTNSLKSLILFLIRSICNDKLYIHIRYLIKFKRPLNLKHPVTFNEKINWLKLYDRNPLYPIIVDKFAVREYVKSKIGEEYLINIINVYRNIREIDYDNLPNSFVLKATHGSGWVVLCPDKSNLNRKQANKKMEFWLSQNFYNLWGEWPYNDVQPGIICEQFLIDLKQPVPNDYKIYCFNGKPTFIHVDIGRFQNLTRTFFSLDWEILPFEKGYLRYSKPIKKPICLSEMVDIAKKLSDGIPFVRVDLYEVNNKVYFGELTLYPMNGLGEFKPGEYNISIGNYLKLPEFIIKK